MTSITGKVWKFLEEDVVARRALEKSITSTKGLARYILDNSDLECSLDAVVSAIRRYEEEQPVEKKFETARKVISGSLDIKLTTKMARISLERSKHTQKLLPDAFSKINVEKGETLLLIQGEKSVKLMVNEKNKEKISGIFPNEEIISIEGDIAEINIQLTEDAMHTPGILAILSTELMLHDVNVMESVSCLPELIFFVNQDDVVKAYKILFELCKAKA